MCCRDFAYPTVKDRLPVILTTVIDSVHRMREAVERQHGQEAVEDLKSIVGRLSKLKYELQTNKPLTPLEDDLPDVTAWNEYLQKQRAAARGAEPSWFVCPWLYVECYFYRRIREAIYLSDKLKDLDPFEDLKQNALMTSLPACQQLATYLSDCTKDSCSGTDQLQELLSEFIQISLWGNKCDLSISAGRENTQEVNAVGSLESLAPRLLCTEVDQIWKHLSSLSQSESAAKDVRIDLVLDNAGFELFTDLCLADFLLESKIATSIRLHGKAMPWFVSDVNIHDLQWTLDQLEKSDSSVLRLYGQKWKTNLENGVWKYSAHEYWTLPHDFAAMELDCPDLYLELAASSLLIFKGDLNYRKLTGDLKWDFDTPFVLALRGFSVAPLCALRTLKCDLAVGITNERATHARSLQDDWMLTGRWGVVQYSAGCHTE